MVFCGNIVYREIEGIYRNQGWEQRLGRQKAEGEVRMEWNGQKLQLLEVKRNRTSPFAFVLRGCRLS